MYRVKITFDEKKKDAEMIFNIQWKNKTVCVDARSNMVGMLDGSATNDYHTFKSYLLNNSGTFVNNVDNVRVSYIVGDNECYIEDDFDYNYALSFFREKALAGQYIDLKLDYVDRSRVKDKEVPPPDWFLKYMKKFKEEIVSEVSAAVMSKQHPNNSHPIRKLKPECYKRNRKVPLLTGDTNEELLTKVRTKLEKLEHKATKIKTKKALMGLSSDSDAGKSSKSETNHPQSAENDVTMSAALITPNKKSNVAYLSGGETYVHSWDVKNNGSLPWNSSTKLKYAWGSQAFEPWEKNITCPYLKPGETGCISAIFNVPALPGMYECYWHFYNNGKRFGISLSSVVMVVDNPVRAENYIRSPTYDVINIQDNYELVLPSTWTTPPQKRNSQPSQNDSKCAVEDTQKSPASSSPIIIEAKDVTDCINVTKVTNEKENCDQFQGEGDGVENNDGLRMSSEKNLNESSEMKNDNNIEIEDKIDFDLFEDESDDQSIISISDSNSSCTSKDDFVLLDSKSPTMKVDNVLQNGSNDVGDLLVDAIQDATNGVSDIKLEEKVENNDENKQEEKVDKTVDEVNNQTNEANDVDTVENIVLKDPIINEIKCNTASDKNNVEDVINFVNKSIEPSTSCKNTSTEYAYIIYDGKKIPIPKRYLFDDYLKSAEDVPKGATSNISDYETKNVSDLKSKDNGTIPKNIKNVKKQKAAKQVKTRSVSTQSKTVGTLKRCDMNLRDLYGCSEIFKDVRKTNQIATVCSNSVLNERRKRQKNKESVDAKQRFFVFPQQGPGYEMVEHFQNTNDTRDYRLKTNFDKSSGIINMYILYYFDYHIEPDIYAYFVPLEDVQDVTLKTTSSEWIDGESIFYAVPVDIEALLNADVTSEQGLYDYRFVLTKLHRGPVYDETGEVLFNYPPIRKQSVYNLAALKYIFQLEQVNKASFDKQLRCVVSWGAESFVMYEVTSVLRDNAFNMNIRPQNRLLKERLRLCRYISLTRVSYKPETNYAIVQKDGEETLSNKSLDVMEEIKRLSLIYEEKFQEGDHTCLYDYRIKKHFDKPSGIINMFILYYIEYEKEPDAFAYFLPLEHVEESSLEPPSNLIQNKNELIFYAIPVDLDILFRHSCENYPCNTPFCDRKFILISLNTKCLNAGDIVWYPIRKKYLCTLAYLKRYYIVAIDGSERCVVQSVSGEKYYVYAVCAIAKEAAINMNIRPRKILTDLKNHHTRLRLCTNVHNTSQHIQNANDPKEILFGKQNVQRTKLTAESKEKVNLRNEKSNSIKTTSDSLPKPNQDDFDNSQKKNKGIKGTGETDGSSRISGLFEGFKGKMDDIRNTVIDTAKDLVDIVTLPNQSNIGYWYQGHWISTNPNSKREQGLKLLQEMGFNNRDLNATLLARYGDDLTLTLSRLLEYTSDV